jgi:hypothetical protein
MVRKPRWESVANILKEKAGWEPIRCGDDVQFSHYVKALEVALNDEGTYDFNRGRNKKIAQRKASRTTWSRRG